MSQQPCDRIFVRDRERSLCWQACDEWDRTTMLACLSSDPRSLEELALAWSRYRPDQPLMELEWCEADRPRKSGQWLAIDLAAQRYAWRDPEDLAAKPGCYELTDEELAGRNRFAWINVPPWWRAVPPKQWPFTTGRSSPDSAARPGAARSRGGSMTATERRPPLDFRSVLYGRPLVEFIAQQAKEHQQEVLASDSAFTDAEANEGRGNEGAAEGDEGLCSSADAERHESDGATVTGDPSEDWCRELSREERAQVKRWEKLTKRIHAGWLMTPRDDLAGKRPRRFLHAHREWKDRELDQRRSQWSRERRPPPPAPRTSDLFCFGPMGLEEVTHYFDLCRYLIGIALQMVDDEPRVAETQLIERLELARDDWLSGEAMEGDRFTVQEVIDGERQLIPRVASSDPFDCDCPLCRIHELEPDLFGPAFWMCDTFREEMEEEFAFSLHARQEDWQKARDEWLSWSYAPIERGEASDSDASNSDEAGGDARYGRSEAEAVSTELPDGDWPKVWETSFSDDSHGSPRLSLLGIGGHLGEIIDQLKELGAAREEINRLNRAFDELAHAVRRWLAREPPRVQSGEPSSFEPAAAEMIQLLERAALEHPELTAKSADLQSQIHQWQRQLSPS